MNNKLLLGALKGDQSYMHPQTQQTLFDPKAFGYPVPAPPRPPVKTPKDVSWWGRNNGGMNASNTPGGAGGNPHSMLLQIINSKGLR